MTFRKRRILAALLALALCLSLLPMSALAAETTATTEGGLTVSGGEAGTDYTYEDNTLTIKTGKELTVFGTTTTDKIVVEGGVTANLTLNGVSIAFADGSVTTNDKEETGAGTCALSLGEGSILNLTIADENTLQSGAGRAGIFVPQNSTLTINGEGTLNVTGGNLAAGIGGDLWHNAGTITIKNGIINATGGSDAAAIGGGHANDGLDQQYGGFTSISITGGTVNAETTGNSAAIGTGCWWKAGSCSISIHNAIVTASTTGTHKDCAAIGRGISDGNNTVSVAITDSIVTATNTRGNSISSGGSNDVTIENSIVSVSAGSGSTGSPTLNGTLVISDTQTLNIHADNTLTLNSGAVLNNKGTITNSGTITGDGSISNNGTIMNSGTITGGGSISNNGTIYNKGTLSKPVNGNEIVNLSAIKFLDKDGNERSVESYTLLTSDTISWTNGWYVALDSISIPSRVTVTGDVHLILTDGASLDAAQGVNVGAGNSLTIYGQSSGTGKLTATGGWTQAGIGGQSVGTGTITINGGTVTSTGGDYGAGIGSGAESAGGTITINGGMVTATGGTNGAAGIGCGAQGVGGTITITGGTVIANGNNYADGIGSGRSDHGTVFSTGNDGHAVIITNGISDESNKDSWDGVIFDRDSYNGQVYGSNVTPTEDFTIPADYTLTIENGKTLTISEDVTLTNNGTIICNGTINGDVDGDVRYPSGVTVTISGEGVTSNTAPYGSTITITATMQRAQTNGINSIAELGYVNFYLGDTSGTLLGTSEVKRGTDGTYTATLEVTLDDATNWIPNDTPYTITADFGGVEGTSSGDGLISSAGSATLTVTKGNQPAPTAPLCPAAQPPVLH